MCTIDIKFTIDNIIFQMKLFHAIFTFGVYKCGFHDPLRPPCGTQKSMLYLLSVIYQYHLLANHRH